MRLTLFMALLCLAACSSVDPTNPFDPETPAEQQATGVMTGRFLLPDDYVDRGFDGFSVKLTGPASTRGQGERQADADAGGGFTLSGLVAGVWEVRFDAPGFRADPRVVSLPIGGSAELGEIPLQPAFEASLAGRVLLAGVSAEAHGGTQVQVKGTPRGVVTLPDGSYEFTAGAGTYTLRFSHAGYTSAEVGGVVLADGAQTVVPDVTLLGAPAQLLGRVAFAPGYGTEGERRPVEVEWRRVDAPPGDSATSAVTTVLEDQVFTFEGLAAGRYETTARWQGFASLPTERQVLVGESADIGQLVLLPPSEDPALSARVLGTAQRFGAPDGTHAGIRVQAVDTPTSTETGSDGSFSLTLPAGPYTLRFTADGYGTQNVEVLLPAGEETPLPAPVLLQAQPGSLAGRVEFAPGYESDGAARPVEVSLARVDLDAETSSQVALEGEGFRFDGLSPGRYRVSARWEAYASAPVERLVDIGKLVDAGLLLLQPPALGSPARALVRGHAERVGAPDDGHGDIAVEVVDTPLSATTASDGYFELAVPSGPQRLRFTAVGYAEADADVNLAEGETFTLPSTALLEGQSGRLRGVVVVLSGAEPVAPEVLTQVAVELWALGEDQPRRTVNPRLTGEFVLDPVSAGEWRVVARLEGFAPFPRLVTLLPGEDVALEPMTLRTPGDAGGERTFVAGSARLDCAGCDHGGIRIETVGFGFVTQTTADGVFRLELSPADHELRFSRAGYAPETRQVRNLVPGENRLQDAVVDARPVLLVAAEGRLSGGVALGAFDGPARRGSIRVRLNAADGTLIGPLPTDPTGAFAFEGLRRGPYTVTATAPGYTDAATPADVNGDAETRVGALLLRHDSDTEEQVPLAVSISLDDGAAPAGTTVRVSFASDEALFAGALADAGGSVVLPASPDETYFLDAEHPGYAVAGRRGPFHWVDPATGFVDDRGAPPSVTLISRPLDGHIRLSVHVTPDWIPAEQRWVQVKLVGGQAQQTIDAARNEDGPIDFEGLAAGAWLLRVSRPGFQTFESVVGLAPGQASRDFGVIEVPLQDLGAATLDLGGETLTAEKLDAVGLAGANLAHVTFEGDFHGRDFSGADLTNAIFSTANLEGATLAGARLFGASLVGANLEHADLSFASLFGADLSGARLGAASLRYANLTAARLVGARFITEAGEPVPNPPCGVGPRPAVDLEGVILAQANLEHAMMQGVNLRGATLSSARVIEADLSDACLADAVVTLTDLSGTLFSGADLTGAQLVGSVMLDTDFRGARLERTSAISAIIERSDFGCRSEDADGVCLCAHPLSDYDGGVCDPAQGEAPADCACRTRMRGISLNGGNLVGARLVDADLRDATFVGAELGDAVADDADAPGAARVSWDCPALCDGAHPADCPTPPRACSLVPTSFAGSMLDRADLSGLHFAHVDLLGARFRGATVSDAVFSRSRVTDLDFTGADLSAASFAGQSVERVDFIGATMARTDLRDASLRDVDFTRAEMNGTDLTRAHCDPCDLTAAHLTAARLDDLVSDGLTLTGAVLTDVDLTDARFPNLQATGLRVEGGVWTRVHLESAALNRAAIAGTRIVDLSTLSSDLTDARFDDVTVVGSGSGDLGAGPRADRPVGVLFEGSTLFRTGFHRVDWQG